MAKIQRNVNIQLESIAYNNLREKSKNLGKTMKATATSLLEKILSDEYHAVLLKVPKNLSPEELRVWLNENVEILMSKLC